MSTGTRNRGGRPASHLSKIVRLISCRVLNYLVISLLLLGLLAPHATAESFAALSASFVFSPSQPMAEVPITFDANSTTDGTPPYTYAWIFGDGGTATLSSPTVSHAYSAKGMYNVTLTVTDSTNATASTSKAIRVFPWAPLLSGWSGVHIGESNPDSDNPPSDVFPEEPASPMEMVYRNITAKYNAERVIFHSPSSDPELPLSDTNMFNETRLSRTMTIAQAYNGYVILNEHTNCDWTNSSYICRDSVLKGASVTDMQAEWLNFWGNISLTYKNGYDRLVYEPLNEPQVSGTQCLPGPCPDSLRSPINPGVLAYPGNPIVIQDAYQKLIDRIRIVVGDNTHFIIVSNAHSDGDWPVLTDPASKLLLNRHWYYFYNNGQSNYGQEPVVYDRNNSGFYDTLIQWDILITGGNGSWPIINTGIALSSDLKLRFVDTDQSKAWTPGPSPEAVVYDSDNSGSFSTGDILVSGPAPQINSSIQLWFDPRVKFVDSGNGLVATAGNLVWDGSPDCSLVGNTIIDKCRYQTFSYDDNGAYNRSSVVCTWGSSGIPCAQAAADNRAGFMRQAISKFGYFAVSTEIGAQWKLKLDTPPDSSTAATSTSKGIACNYSPTGLAFVQRLLDNYAMDQRLGYTLWVNGNWTGVGLHGCLRNWGNLVVPAPDYAMCCGESVFTAPLRITSGTNATSTLNLTALNNFNGTVSLSFTLIGPSNVTNHPTVTITPRSVTIQGNGTVFVEYSVTTSSLTSTGNYTLVFKGASTVTYRGASDTVVATVQKSLIINPSPG